MFDLVVGLALGYLIGSLPSAAIVARLLGRDIFGTGSGNMGAMNTARNIGWAAGAAVLLLDVGKGASAVLLAQAAATAGGSSLAPVVLPLAAGVGAVAGHGWSAFARLRGGKALATTLGVALPLYPLAALYTGALLVALLLITRRVSLSTLLTVALYPTIVAVVQLRTGTDQDLTFATVTSVIVIALIVALKHLQPPARRDTAPRS